MIQRIQTLYLSLTTLLSLLFLKGSFLNFTGNSTSVIKITFLGIARNVNGQDASITENILPLSVIILLIPVLSLFAIFYFKKRNIQMWFVRILIGVVCCLILVSLYYSYLILTENGGKLIPGVLMFLPLVLLLFASLAFRGIRKDDRLVKSYDRMR